MQPVTDPTMNTPNPLRLSLESAFAAAMHGRSQHERQVQVMLADAREWAAWESDAWALLDVHERMRAARQRRPQERGVRTLAYAMHRVLLAGALGCEPADVPLHRDARGCPRLERDAAWTSLSHAGGLLAFAIGGAGPVGVDIEPVSRHGAIAEIAGAVCHPDEWASLSTEPAHLRAAGLLELWVRKEAVLKAAGVGLEMPMASFTALHSPTVRLPGFPAPWRVTRLESDLQAVAAVATVEGAKAECVRLRPCSAGAPAHVRRGSLVAT